MSVSLREIAREMDPSITNAPYISFSEVGKLHRWGEDDAFQSGVLYRPDKLSLKELVHRHSRGLKFLWFNTYMLPDLKIDTPVYSGQVFTGAPARSARAREIGEAVKESGYDIVALCEVFQQQIEERLLSTWGENTPYCARGPGEGEVKFEIDGESGAVIGATVGAVIGGPVGGIVGGILGGSGDTPTLLTIETQSSGLLTILPGKYGRLNYSDEAFANKGDWKRDADFWSNKGILKVVADTGFNTKLEIYSTHLIYGGGLIGDISDDDRYAIQRKQLDQLVSFIERERDASNFLMVVGDFNIYADEDFYDELRGRMEKLGLEDVWTRYAIARYGAKVGRTGDASSCVIDRPPCERFADDNLESSINEKGRIDYIFTQKPSGKHRDMSVDIARPRRVPFKRSSSSEGYSEIEYFSDHAGIELQLFLSSK